MKMALSQDLVFKMSLDASPVPGSKPQKWQAFEGPNYLVYDDHREAPPGFAVRVGKKASVYLVDKLVAGKKLKIPVGLARGKKGDERPMAIAEAREKAWDLIQTAKRHGANPKHIGDRVEASELTMKDIWDGYLVSLLSQVPPIKPNSEKSIRTARAKLADWEDRKARLISSKEVLDRFDLHAVAKKHRTAAEAMGRWATAAVDHAIRRELHDANAQGRPPSLTYNPFTILRAEKRYRKKRQLERDYKTKGIRNPMSFSTSVGPFVREAWGYRIEHPLAADYLLLTLLWGMRRGESARFMWRDRIDSAEAATRSWIDLKGGKAFVADAKNRSDHEFPLGPCASQILRLRFAERGASPWVFPARSAQKQGDLHYSAPSVALATIRERAEIKTLRGHDLRRTFGAACEKLGFSDRQTKRMLGHAESEGDAVNRYTEAEWADVADRMRRVEELILSSAPSVYNALRPKALPRMPDIEGIELPTQSKKRSRAKAR